MTLPFLDGYALCQILRRDRVTADVPILAITADGHPSHIERARQAGADIVLVKPTSMETVLTEMRRLTNDFKGAGRSATTANLAPPRNESANDVRPDDRRRKPRSKSFARVTTTTPSASPPLLVCPSCDRPLTYRQSHIGGVNERLREQWDDFECVSCGAFQYRHRTRKTSRAS